MLSFFVSLMVGEKSIDEFILGFVREFSEDRLIDSSRINELIWHFNRKYSGFVLYLHF